MSLPPDETDASPDGAPLRVQESKDPGEPQSEPFQLIGLGELLWDCFPDRRLPGGAPANVAFHAQQLSLTTAVATRVGQDELGDELCEFLKTQGLNTDLVQRDPVHHTGTVTVSPNSDGRTDYRFLEDSAWDFLESDPNLMKAVRAAKAICFGTLAQRQPGTRGTIHQCLRAAGRDCLIVYDVNLRPPFFEKDWIRRSIEQASVVKMNADEVKILCQMLEIPSSENVRFAKWLLDHYRNLDLVCITRGGEGCLAVSCAESIDLPGIPITVADTVGAGDAFTAAIIFGQIEGWPLSLSVELANRFGSLVASRPGAMPVLRDELAAMKAELDWSFRVTPVPK
jgi:fructokinase